MPTDIARYSIELFKQGGEGIEQILDRHADIKVARSIYRTVVDANGTAVRSRTLAQG
jgi:hypothetical protein